MGDRSRSRSRSGSKNAAVEATAAKGAVPAAARTLAVFEVFAEQQRELSKSEVARLLGVPESSCSDLLNTLHELGYLSRTPKTRRYYPTNRLLAITKRLTDNDALTAFGAEATAMLARRTGETAVCAVLAGPQMKAQAVTEGNHRLRYVMSVGETFAPHATALGKAVLGGLEDAEMSRVLRLQPLTRRTDKTLTDPSAVEEEVRRSRDRGWYQAVDEGTHGVSSLAISAQLGHQVVGLGLIGPSGRVVPLAADLRTALLDVGRSAFGAPGEPSAFGAPGEPSAYRARGERNTSGAAGSAIPQIPANPLPQHDLLG